MGRKEDIFPGLRVCRLWRGLAGVRHGQLAAPAVGDSGLRTVAGESLAHDLRPAAGHDSMQDRRGMPELSGVFGGDLPWLSCASRMAMRVA